MKPYSRLFSWRRYAWINAALLALLLLGLLLARNIRTLPTGLFLGDIRLPETCLVSRATGRPCAGCGMTRSIVLASAGDWRASLAMHPSGIWLFVYALSQAAFRALALVWRPSVTVRIAIWDLSVSLGGFALASQAPLALRLLAGP